MTAAGLSVFVLAKNAERDLADCLATVREIADDTVIVVDAATRDATADVARSMTPKVFVRPFDGFSAMKSFALSQCAAEWALNLDTDERPTPDLTAEIRRVKEGGGRSVNGYWVNRLPFFLGKPIRHGGWFPDWVIRLVRREFAAYPHRSVHERLEVSGRTERLGGFLNHYTAATWRGFLDKQRRFAGLAPVVPSALARWTRPPAAFLKSLVFRMGLLDGWRGWAVAYAQAYHVYYKYGPRG
ncbi:MAG: hypothetical protein A3G34_06505 [Candidatus Lindowbacteria bacterium RIFCSPLOWO2_12_FULL_62_27]|nr:MAG: hypothetical protein A3G34_06505 [Candidatus Lindowbacteria bacterium RIFCSPLOWO2_12_FULL_62_27]OGH63723.1 MAG: hypothetical protein A3I06_01095 [Candidatus Lindowbacteria bacterium RIFCSPLOWO2_02_FULL_62_12]